MTDIGKTNFWHLWRLNMITDEHAKELGEAVVELLALKSDLNDRYRTEMGHKSVIGLGHSVHSLTKKIEEKCSEH